MTRKDLAKQIAKNSKLRVTDAEKLVIAFGDVIGDTLAKNKKIVYSNFGTFYTVHYPSKVIFHPRLGAAKKMVMLPTDAVKWMPAPNIKELANVGFAGESPTTHGRKGQPAPNIPRSPAKPKKDDSEMVDIPIKFSLSPKSATDLIPTQKDVDIFEEMMNDGTKLESTFSDVIRVRKPNGKGFFNRVFRRDSSAEEGAEENVPINIDPASADNRNSKGFVHQLSTENFEIPIEPFQTKVMPVFSDISSLLISPSLLEQIPKGIAELYEFVPIREDSRIVEIATTDPENKETIDIVKKLTGKDVIVKLAAREAIEQAQSQYPPKTAAAEEVPATVFDSDRSIYGDHDDDNLINIASDNTPSAKIITTLLRRASRDKATAVQINPRPDNFEIHFEIDGNLQTKAFIPQVIQKAVIETIKKWADLDPENTDTPQEGQLSMNFEGQRMQIGVETFPEPGGERIVLRF